MVFYEKPFRGWASRIFRSLSMPKRAFKLLNNQLKQFWNGPISVAKEIRSIIPIAENKLLYAPHHLSHVLSAMPFVPKNLENEVQLHFVFDGVGDDDCHSIYRTKGTKTELLFSQKYPNSLGLFYSAVTDFSGFLINEGEYKLMALAAFGRPIHCELMLSEMIKIEDQQITLNMDWFDFDKTTEKSFSKRFVEEFGEPIQWANIKSREEQEFRRVADLAASAQSVVEKALISIIEWGLGKYDCKAITISGGIAHNSVAMEQVIKRVNQRLPVIIPPSPGDSGGALGAAHFGHIVARDKPIFVMKSSSAQLMKQKVIICFQICFVRYMDSMLMDAHLIEILEAGGIICCFFKGNEMGPRALGNRSIICSAGVEKAVKTLNLKVKKREFFRPLAPMMLKKFAEKHFYIDPYSLKSYEWMALTAHAKPGFPDCYKSALHVDSTSRIQILNHRNHYLFGLLKKMVGRVDVLINTSFNVAGDPIVFDIIDCFTNMKRLGLKYLVTGKGLLKL